MYALSEQQIDFISSDICARGIAMVSLQHDLLDHICCVIERELEPGGDFERCYNLVISRFYKSELKEIEKETVHLLTNKHYYTMKKAMIASGTISVGILTAGTILKFLHLPGAAILLVVGIFLMSFIFLPLMFLLRVGEKQEASQKVISITGGICAMLISVGILFKIMHWPGANMMSVAALLMMLFVFIPIYFFSGIKNPASKVNTIVSTIMMFTGCILILTLIRSPQATHQEYVANTVSYLQADRIVKNEKRQSAGIPDPQAEMIFNLCEDLKTFLIEKETGMKSINDNFESQNAVIGDTQSMQYISQSAQASKKIETLRKAISAYNSSGSGHFQKLPAEVFVNGDKIQKSLNDLMQLQMIVLQNHRDLVAAK
ncbi:MAG: hypothetical protein EOO51_10795 [Flavobacterium sp.]|nr:MAG: hypothetical protein EOO51_10795 [Flavobacterium sp.]